MKEIIKRLEAKWNAFEKDKHLLKQCDISGGRNETYLNVLFAPVSHNELGTIRDAFSCELPHSLLELYKKYNGIMLFSESLRIYGVETNFDALYDTYDIVAQNEDDNIQGYGEQFSSFVVFGYYSSCLFCFDKTNLDFLYVFDTKQEKIVYKFKNLVELLTHYVDYLINEYDENGKKIHLDKSLEGLPIANVSLEFI